MACTKIEGASKRGVEDAAPYRGARLRFSVVGDGVPDVPNLEPQRAFRYGLQRIRGANSGRSMSAPTNGTYFVRDCLAGFARRPCAMRKGTIPQSASPTAHFTQGSPIGANQPRAPLCKGSRHGAAVTEGLCPKARTPPLPGSSAAVTNRPPSHLPAAGRRGRRGSGQRGNRPRARRAA